MGTKSWAHGRECLCDKCEVRRAYNRAYYRKNRSKVLRKNNKWNEENRGRETKTKAQAYQLRVERTKELHGENFFAKIGTKGGNRTKAKIGHEGFVVLGKKGGAKKRGMVTPETILAGLDRI